VPVVRDFLYRPYLRELSAIEGQIERRFGAMELKTGRKLRGNPKAGSFWLKNTIKMMLNRQRGYIIAPD